MDTGSLIGLLVYIIVIVGVIGYMITMQWKIMEKAGKPGWVVLVPIYNLIVYLEVIGKPTWWILIAICGGPIFQILTSMDLAERFGQERNWGIIWLWLLAPIGLWKLAMDDSFQYTAPTNPA